MIWIFVLGIVSLFVTFVAGAKASSGGWMLLAAVSAVSTFLCVLLPIVVYSSRSVGSTACRHWGEQVGVPTKFAILSWANTGICLAKTPTGHWINKDNWQAFTKADK